MLEMGQWGHNYPDQGETHSNLASGYGKEAYANMSRMDWAIEIFNWFEYWLKGVGDETESYVQMQTHDGRWHLEETWPPADITDLVVSPVSRMSAATTFAPCAAKDSQ